MDIDKMKAAVIAAEDLADAMDAVTHMHGTNPSDACADMPEADYLKYFLGEVRSHAREALAAYREATS